MSAANPPTSCAAPLLQVRELCTSFATRHGVLRAVDGVSFDLYQAQTLAIVGESGSGKSVTGLSLIRLFGRTGARIDSGAIWFGHEPHARVDLANIDERALASIRGRRIGIIFQDPMSSLNPVLRIGDQIGESLRWHRGASKAVAREQAIALLRAVGIGDAGARIDAYPHQLSGGMRQRVMIAIALAGDPQLLIADEPTTALDVTIQAQITDLLRELQRQRQMAMIFITHDLALVADIADQIAVMYAGEIVESGAARAVLEQPRHPYTRALIACLPRDALAVGRRLRPIAGTLPDPMQRQVGCRFAPRCEHVRDSCRDRHPALDPVTRAMPSDSDAAGNAPDAGRITGGVHQVRCWRWRELAA